MQSVLLLTACSAIPLRGGAQIEQVEPTLVPDEPVCGECRLEHRLVATVHDTTYEGGAWSTGPVPHLNENGTFLLIGGGAAMDELYLADTSGATVRRIGGKGEGPGEFRLVMHVVEQPDAFWILDMRNGRVSELDKETLAFRMSFPIRGGVSGAEPIGLPGGGMVTWGSLPTRESAGHGLHHISPEGELIRSFGPAPAGDAPVLATAEDGGIWVGFDDYRIEKWELDGRKTAELRRAADWIRPKTEGTEDGDRTSWLVGLDQDDQGRLWTHTAVRIRGADYSDPSSVESVLEVIDPDRGVVLARDRAPGTRDMTIASACGLYRSTRRTSALGHVLLDVWRSRLIMPPNSPY